MNKLIFITFLFNLEDTSPFCGDTDSLFHTSGDVCPGLQIQGGLSYALLIFVTLSFGIFIIRKSDKNKKQLLRIITIRVFLVRIT